MTDDRSDGLAEERVGEVARRELAAAAHDPRLDRAAGTPVPDFNDAIAEIGRGRRAAILSLERTARAETDQACGAEERQALWEQAQLAWAERAGDYAWINAATLWGLHSALDALVEQNSPAVAGLVTRIQAQEFVNQAAAAEQELAAQLPEGVLQRIVEVAATVALEKFKIAKPRGNGATRWENPLRTVDLAAPDDRPIPAAMDRALTELCVLRDVLSHRGGRVDQKAADEWPSAAIEVGSFVRVTQAQARRYSAAAGAYGAEISRRLLARFSVTVNVDLTDWERHGFLI